MKYKINFEKYSGIFAVPVDIVDKYIKIATRDDLKVILMIIRNSDENIDEEVVADRLNLSLDSVITSLEFWTQKGMLLPMNQTMTENMPASVNFEEQMNYNVATQLSTPPPMQDNSVQKIKVSDNELLSQGMLDDNEKINENIVVKKSGFKPSFSDVAKRLEEVPEFSFILDEVQNILGKELSNSEITAIVSLIDYTHVEFDVLLMIIQYCKMNNKTNMRYIEKTVYNFLEKGLNSHEKVALHIETLSQNSKIESQVIKELGIGNRALSQKEQSLIDNWIVNYNFSIDIIKLAYDRMVDSIGKVQLSYMDGILRKWYDLNITTCEAAEEQIRNYSQSVKNQRAESSLEEKPSYDSNSLYTDAL